MAEKSFPLEGKVYTAEDAALWFATRTSGVYASSQLGVTAADGMTVTIGTGMAWLKYADYAGVAYANTEAKTLQLATADANYPRIDRVVIRYSKNDNNVCLAVKTGTAATAPSAPDVTRDSSTYEISLVQIYVAANASSISGTNITDERLNNTVCGLMSDGVTGVDTTTINMNFEAFMDEKQTEFDEWFASVQSALDGDTAGNLLNLIEANTADIETKVSMTTATATLTVGGWANNAQTVSVAGVTANSTLIVTAAPESYEHYNECVVRCSAQGEGTLTFTCTDVPSSAVAANVLILV